MNAKVSPTVPPICRKSVRSLVAAPSSEKGTAFCTMIVKTAMDGPIPTPAMNIQVQSIASGVSARRFVISRTPTAARASAATASHL